MKSTEGQQVKQITLNRSLIVTTHAVTIVSITAIATSESERLIRFAAVLIAMALITMLALAVLALEKISTELSKGSRNEN